LQLVYLADSFVDFALLVVPQLSNKHRPFNRIAFHRLSAGALRIVNHAADVVGDVLLTIGKAHQRAVAERLLADALHGRRKQGAQRLAQHALELRARDQDFSDAFSGWLEQWL
jgi:hypothetical protein